MCSAKDKYTYDEFGISGERLGTLSNMTGFRRRKARACTNMHMRVHTHCTRMRTHTDTHTTRTHHATCAGTHTHNTTHTRRGVCWLLMTVFTGGWVGGTLGALALFWGFLDKETI